MAALSRLRIAFLGHAMYFERCVPRDATDRLVPAFFDVRDGIDPAPAVAAAAAFDPHVAVVFRPDGLAGGALDPITAPVLGVLTESLPRPGRSSHAILDHNLAQLRRLEPHAIDRALVCDPLGFATAAEILPAWRSMPLPVADHLFRAPQRSAHPPRMVTLGPSTPYREHAIIGLKHKFDLLHYAHGPRGEELEAVLRSADVGLVVRGERHLITFMPDVLLHMAAGHLTVATAVDPACGLERGLDFLEVDDEHELDLRIHQLHQRPDAYDRIRHRGFRAAQQFRASLLWDRVARDLLDDLRVFGTGRGRLAA